MEAPEGFDDALLRNALTNKLPGVAIDVRRNSQLLRPKVIDAFVPETHGLVHEQTQKDYGSDDWHSRGRESLLMMAEDVFDEYKRNTQP
jgi:hypothetical protein